jgi:hypothetical protein
LVVAFENNELRRICEDEYYATSVFGEEVKFHLLSRLADIEAADCIADILVGKPEEVVIRDLSCFKIDVLDDVKIIIANNDIYSKPKFDWKTVRRIKILNIGNYEF